MTDAPAGQGHLLLAGTDAKANRLVLLHGSGGDASDLVAPAAALAPERSILALRGAVTWEGGYAFFRRLPDRSIDTPDLTQNVDALAAALYERMRHGPAPIAIGFSNGAIMAAALLMRHPRLLSGAVLLRPLSPYRDDVEVMIPGIPVLSIEGARDDRRAPGDGARLAARLAICGARMDHRILQAGHAVTAEDWRIVRAWLQRQP